MSPHRLLYRGALSLPDSNLLLDGITFFAPVLGAGLNLLQNQLALALESMRGRPSLAFVRVEKLRDLCLDSSGDVRMSVLRPTTLLSVPKIIIIPRDIHPQAVLSRIYFENTFCLLPCPSMAAEARSAVGVRVAVGDITDVLASSSVFPRFSVLVPADSTHAQPLQEPPKWSYMRDILLTHLSQHPSHNSRWSSAWHV